MPNPSEALLAFGKLVAFLDGKGEVQFAWIGDPLDKSLAAIPAERKRLHDLLQSLIHEGPTGAAPALPLQGLTWEPVNLGADIGIGFAWNNGGTSDPLHLGLGAAASFEVGGKTIDLAVLARLIKVQNDLVSEIPGIVFGGTIPVPDFLHSASLQGEIPSVAEIVSLTVEADATNARTLKVPGGELAWDSARLVIFVLQAWVRDQTTGGDNVFDRIDEHLFPMFGDPSGGPIEPFPLFGEDNMGTLPNFEPWVDSVLSFDDDAVGALTFLWHFRALLTGVEDSSFFDGSMFFPLAGQPSSGSPPTLSDSLGELSEGTDGAFVGVEKDPVDPEESADLQLVIRLQEGGSKLTIPLAKRSGGTLARPNLVDDPAQIKAFDFPGWTPIPTGLRIIDETLAPANGFGGSLFVDLLLTQGEPVGYQVTLPTTPALELTFPGTGGGPFPKPNYPPEAAFNDVLASITGASENPTTGPLVGALQSMIGAAVRGQSLDPLPVITAILSAAPLVPEDVGEIELGEDGAVLKVGLELDDVSEAFAKNAVSIGNARLDAEFALTDPGDPLQPPSDPLRSAKLRLEDVRVDPAAAEVSGVAGSLLSDLTEAPGFSLNVEWKPPNTVTPSGGGKIPIQQTIGPLEVSTLNVEIDEDALEIGVDGAFTMGPVSVIPYELGARFPFSADPATAQLRGLGLMMDTGGIKLAGHFAETDSDYVGAAIVSVVDFFELSAIGGYTQLSDGSDSMFIFASLVAPLGGPPFLFVTGIAGGFGYNRLLPPPGPIADNPFMRVMRGDIVLSGGPGNELKILGEQFLPSKGQNWIAAGLQFTSFGFIQGKLVVVIGFPNFSLQILGSAAFAISPIAYFEIEMQATANDVSFQLIAGLSHNSYLIHPDIFSLHGQFGLATWHGTEHPGDFVFSIGGYHNAFSVPAHYPTLERVGAKATVYGFIQFSVDCYFATTPRAMMAGAAISLSADFEAVTAGLDVYVDVYIQWDPFFIQGTISVVVWCDTFVGRLEVGVALEIHTPPLGGTATIDAGPVSFDIDFGSPLITRHPTMAGFLEGQLGLEADPWNGDGARVAALSTSDRPGLFRLEVLWGRTAEAESKTVAQEGIDVNSPIRVSSEFGFAVRTLLPLGGVKVVGPHPPDSASMAATIHLPLCELADLGSTLRVEGTEVGTAQPVPVDEAFPGALFGSEFNEVHLDSFMKDLIGMEDPAEAVVDLTEGMAFNYFSDFDPVEAAGWDIVATEELLPGEAPYPLPLGTPARNLSLRSPKPQLVLAQGERVIEASGPHPVKLERSVLIRQRIESRVATPLRVTARSAPVERRTKIATTDSPDFTTPPPSVPVAAPPTSPVRRRDMRGVELRRVEPHLQEESRRGARRTAGLVRPVVTTLDGVKLSRVGSRDQTELQVKSGHAVHLELKADRAVPGDFVLRGEQIVRGIFLDAYGKPVADLYLPANHSSPLPPRSRSVVFFGEGPAAPVGLPRATRGSAAPVPRPVEAIGVELESILTALSPRAFAARGCVVALLTPYSEPVRLFDSLTGFDLLPQIPILRVHFPPVPKDGTLVLHFECLGGEAGAAIDQIRWRTLDAALGSLRTVVQPDRVAFTTTAVADEPWLVEVDLGPAWRLSGIAWRPQAQRETLDWLGSSASWDMTDDRSSDAEREPVTSIDLTFET